MNTNLSKPITIPIWAIGVIILIFILLLGGGGYGFKEHRVLKRNYKDSLKVRDRKLDSLAVVLEYSNEFQNNTQEIQKNYYNEYKQEQKLRRNAESKLFIYRNNDRVYIDSFLSNYKYRRVKPEN